MNDKNPHVFIDSSDNLLTIINCYEYRENLAVAGCRWDATARGFKVVFADITLERVLDCLPPETTVDPSLEASLLGYLEQTKKLEELREASKGNKPIDLVIPGIKIDLFDYQKVGVLFSTTCNFGVLLGDQMGTGKTCMSMAAAMKLKAEGKASNCLVLTPASLKWNWALEIEKFTDATYVIVDGKADERIGKWNTDSFFTVANYDLLDDLFGGRDVKIKRDDTVAERIKKAERKLKSSIRSRELECIRERVWDIIIIDEAQAICGDSQRSKRVKALRARRKIACSGTPIDGKLEQLFSVFEFVAPGLLGSKRQFFEDHVRTGFYESQVIGYKNIGAITKKIQPFFIRRLKKDIMTLPEKVYSNRLIDLTPDERRIYTEICKGEHVSTKDKDPMIRVLRARQFINLPSLVDPSCSASSKLNDFETVLQEICVDNAEKAIVFDASTKMLDELEVVIKKLGLKFLRIDGTTPATLRADYQKMFNNSNDIDLVIGSDAMSAGLNLTGASYCLNYSSNFCPSIMDQREDRLHRHGQKNQVTVINWIVRNTVEERVRELIYGKAKISDQVLGDNTDEGILMKFSNEELMKLL